MNPPLEPERGVELVDADGGHWFRMRDQWVAWPGLGRAMSWPVLWEAHGPLLRYRLDRAATVLPRTAAQRVHPRGV